MPLANDQKVVHSNGSLFLESITKEDEGVYKCNITNGIGNSLVKTVMVKVIGMVVKKSYIFFTVCNELPHFSVGILYFFFLKDVLFTLIFTVRKMVQTKRQWVMKKNVLRIFNLLIFHGLTKEFCILLFNR